MSSPVLRVAHVVLSLEPGGTESLVIDLAQRMRSLASVRVYCLDAAGRRASELLEAGIPVDVVGRRPGFDLRVARRLRGRARRDRINVLHCHQYTPFIYGSIAAATGAGVSVVFTEHGRASDAPPSRRRRAANLVFGQLPGSIFAVSDDLRQFMEAEGFPRNRIGVVHNGIDAGCPVTPADRSASRATLGLPETAFVLGTAARLDPVKDLATMVEAFAFVRARVSNAHLIVAGEGTERSNLERLAAERGIRDAVYFVGHRPDIRALLPAFDVYVNSSIFEGLSVTILEAMAAALPVVATGAGGTPEVVAEGSTGFLVPPRDATALADRVVRLANEPKLRSTFGAAGRERVLSEFSADRMMQHYLEVYRRASRRGKQ